MARCWLRWLIYGVEEVWMASKQSRLQGDGKVGAWGGVLELGGKALARGPSDAGDVQGYDRLVEHEREAAVRSESVPPRERGADEHRGWIAKHTPETILAVGWNWR